MERTGRTEKHFKDLLYAAAFAVAAGIFPRCEKDTEPPVQPTKSIEQYVGLNNDVEIKYTATLSNVDKAQLNINKDGALLSTKEINDINQSGTDYDKVFTYTIDGITKGSYEFVAKGDNIEKKNSVVIQNYKPTANFTNLNLDLQGNSETNLTLPIPSDKNPEDNPVSYTNAKSLDGKTSATLTGNNLKINALPSNTGPYQIEVEYGSPSGGLEKSVLTGNITGDNKIIVNLLVQPNDSTLNWYGSGDVNKNNTLESGDLTRMDEILGGYFSDPTDTRLYDRADVNGDGSVTSEDRKLIQDKLNGIISHLPAYWNELNKEEQISWIKKTFAIDKTDENPWTNEYDCTKFVYQTNINFSGYKNGDISNLRTFYPFFDFSKNGRFNLPLHELQLVAYDSEGNPTAAHDINVIFVGSSIQGEAPSWNDLIKIEPQDDNMNIQFGEGQLAPFYTNSKFYLKGSPITSTTRNEIDSKKYIIYKSENNIFSLESVSEDIILVKER